MVKSEIRNQTIIFLIILFMGIGFSLYYKNISTFGITAFGVFIAFMLNSIRVEVIEANRDSSNLKKTLQFLVDEIENNYKKLSGEPPNEILQESTYQTAKVNNTLQLIDWDTLYKLERFYEKIHRINDDVSRLLNSEYFQIERTPTFVEKQNLLQDQINRERASAKDLASYILGLIEQKYKIPSLHIETDVKKESISEK